MEQHKRNTVLRAIWHKILQTICGMQGHQWHKTGTGDIKVMYCRKCGKMVFK